MLDLFQKPTVLLDLFQNPSPMDSVAKSGIQNPHAGYLAHSRRSHWLVLLHCRFKEAACWACRAQLLTAPFKQFSSEIILASENGSHCFGQYLYLVSFKSLRLLSSVANRTFHKYFHLKLFWLEKMGTKIIIWHIQVSFKSLPKVHCGFIRRGPF